MEFDEAARARIAAALRGRRAQLGMSQEEVSRASGGMVSTANVRVMEGSGRSSFRSRSLTGVARALGWPGDALLRIAAGEDPATFVVPIVESISPSPTVAGIDLATVAHLDELRTVVEELRIEVAAQGRVLVELATRLERLAPSGLSTGSELVSEAAFRPGELDDPAAPPRRTTRSRVEPFVPEEG